MTPDVNIQGTPHPTFVRALRWSIRWRTFAFMACMGAAATWALLDKHAVGVVALATIGGWHWHALQMLWRIERAIDTARQGNAAE